MQMRLKMKKRRHDTPNCCAGHQKSLGPLRHSATREEHGTVKGNDATPNTRCQRLTKTAPDDGQRGRLPAAYSPSLFFSPPSAPLVPAAVPVDLHAAPPPECVRCA
jgi:hypothetical protein